MSIIRNGHQRKLKLREKLAEAQNWRCCYCGKNLEKHEATIEHVVPLRQGGANNWSNMAIACSPCNYRRSGWPGIGP